MPPLASTRPIDWRLRVLHARWRKPVPRALALPTIALAIALLAPITGCSLLHARAASAAGPSKAAPVKAVLTLKPFLVNLADPGGTSFLRTTVALGLSAPPAENADATPSVAAARDAIIAVLTASTSAELLAPHGKTELKARLLQAVRAKAPKLPVTSIYLTGFLIQR